MVGSSSSRWEGRVTGRRRGSEMMPHRRPDTSFSMLGGHVAKGSQCVPQVESNIGDQNIRAPGQREINQETSLTHKAPRFLEYSREGRGFPGGSVVKHLPAMQGDTGDSGSIPGSGRSPGGGNGNPFQYQESHGQRNWWAVVHGVAKSRARLSMDTYVHTREGRSCSQTHTWVTSHKKVTLRSCTRSPE